MDYQQAQRVLQSLIDGVDPSTGEELPPTSVLQRAEVLRALLAGKGALQQAWERAERRAKAPVNASKPWSAADRQKLIADFQAGTPIEELARIFGRTVRAIEDQLVKFEALSPEQRITRSRWGHLLESSG